MTRRPLLLAAEILTPLVLIAAVWLLSLNSTTFYFPAVPEILSAFQSNWLFQRWSSDVLPSLGRLASGYLLAAVIGISAGLLLGRSERLRRQASPVMEFLRALPPPALIPLSILLLGIGSSAKILLISFVCLWPILLNTVDGTRGIDPTLRDTGRSYRLSAWSSIWHVELPAAAPKIFAGLRTALPLALILMVISEMVGSTNGLGYFVIQSQRTFAIADMWSGILLLGLLGYALNALFGLVESRVLAWHRHQRAGAH